MGKKVEMKTVTRESARVSLIRGTNNKKHICETLRLIYDEVCEFEDNPNCNDCREEIKETMTELLIDAMIMAKKMQNRLAYYQKKYKDNTGNKAVGLVGLTGVNARARMRKAREL